MIDLRKEKVLDLTSAICLKDEATFIFEDAATKKKLIAKFIAYYDDDKDEYLIAEFKKIALLSAEPEIATVYFLATADFGRGPKSCYVMDFVDGETLGAVIQKNKNLSADFVVDILAQLAKGMEKSHHYEISHGDLHGENVMINNFGYVKIIDFLWWDFNLSFLENSLEDIKSYKLLVSILMSKLTDQDKKKFTLISEYLKNITLFNKVADNILVLVQVADEFSLIDVLSKEILSVIVSQINPEATLAYVIQEREVAIPNKHISELTDSDKTYMESEKNGRIKLKYSDERGFRTQQTIDNIFRVKLHQLRQAGLIDWEMTIDNKGEKFLGPYILNYQIFFTSKLFKWKRLNEEFRFLQKPNKTLIELMLD